MSQLQNIEQPDKPVRVRQFRLSDGKRTIISEYLDKSFTHKCFFCPKTEKLEIHRKDPSRDYSIENCLWACKSCNLSHRVFAKDTSELASVSVQKSVGDEDEDSLGKNRRTEPAWVEYVTAVLEEKGATPKDWLTGNSANWAGISVATVARHWKKYGCELGPFHIYRPFKGSRVLVELRKRPGLKKVVSELD